MAETVNNLPPGSVVISGQQATLHMLSEAVGLFVTVPALFYASQRLPNEAERRAAFWMGMGALVVDGVLFYRFLTKTTDRPFL